MLKLFEVSNTSYIPTLNGTLLERQTVTNILGLWIQEDLMWENNTRQICKKAYSRMFIFNKLKLQELVKVICLQYSSYSLGVFVNNAVQSSIHL